MGRNDDIGSLVLTLKVGDTILIGDDISLQFMESGTRLRVRVTAPKSIQIDRARENGELYDKKEGNT